jgi:alpha-amylase
MEGWSLPADQAVRLAAIEEDMGKERIAGPDGALLRGSHWRNFLVKYSESNRMHKKMLALSALTRRRGDPVGPRRAVGRAQCNDAYWHGVFGGLYLPHLREGIWRQLATAEGELRAGEALAHEVLDIDYDGRDEIWVHSSRFSAIVVPHRGGAIEEYTIFGTGRNYADSLTRRREAYHRLGVEAEPEHRDATTVDDAAPSIHDLEHGLRVDELPPVDLDDRAMFVDRMLPPRLGADDYARADYQPVASWARASLAATVSVDGEAIEIVMTGRFGFEKRIRFDADGSLSVSWAWDSADFPADALFAPEISLARPLVIRAEPDVQALWRYPIETVAKSERGLDRTVQGESMTPIWRARLGAARIDLEAPGADASPE